MLLLLTNIHHSLHSILESLKLDVYLLARILASKILYNYKTYFYPLTNTNPLACLHLWRSSKRIKYGISKRCLRRQKKKMKFLYICAERKSLLLQLASLSFPDSVLEAARMTNCVKNNVHTIMHQSFKPPPWAWWGHSRSVCESQWSSWTPGQKYWVKSPPLGTQLYKPKSPVQNRLWQHFLNPLARHWAFLREENVNANYANNLHQMFKLPSGMKKLAWSSDSSKSSAHSLPQMTSSRL